MADGEEQVDPLRCKNFGQTGCTNQRRKDGKDCQQCHNKRTRPPASSGSRSRRTQGDGITPVPPDERGRPANACDDDAVRAAVSQRGPADAPITRADLEEAAAKGAAAALQAAGMGPADPGRRPSLPSEKGSAKKPQSTPEETGAGRLTSNGPPASLFSSLLSSGIAASSAPERKSILTNDGGVDNTGGWGVALVGRQKAAAAMNSTDRMPYLLSVATAGQGTTPESDTMTDFSGLPGLDDKLEEMLGYASQKAKFEATYKLGPATVSSTQALAMVVSSCGQAADHYAKRLTGALSWRKAAKPRGEFSAVPVLAKKDPTPTVVIVGMATWVASGGPLAPWGYQANFSSAKAERAAKIAEGGSFNPLDNIIVHADCPYYSPMQPGEPITFLRHRRLLLEAAEAELVRLNALVKEADDMVAKAKAALLAQQPAPAVPAGQAANRRGRSASAAASGGSASAAAPDGGPAEGAAERDGAAAEAVGRMMRQAQQQVVEELADDAASLRKVALKDVSRAAKNMKETLQQYERRRESAEVVVEGNDSAPVATFLAALKKLETERHVVMYVLELVCIPAGGLRLPHEIVQHIKGMQRRTGATVVVDETFTAGRYPGFFASSEYNLTPDVITVGKGLASMSLHSTSGGLHLSPKHYTKDAVADKQRTFWILESLFQKKEPGVQSYYPGKDPEWDFFGDISSLFSISSQVMDKFWGPELRPKIWGEGLIWFCPASIFLTEKRVVASPTRWSAIGEEPYYRCVLQFDTVSAFVDTLLSVFPPWKVDGSGPESEADIEAFRAALKGGERCTAVGQKRKGRRGNEVQCGEDGGGSGGE